MAVILASRIIFYSCCFGKVFAEFLPETNGQQERFHFYNIRHMDGSTGMILHSLDPHQPVCLNNRRNAGRHLALVSHKLCREMGYQTMEKLQLVESTRFKGWSNYVRREQNSRNSTTVHCRQDLSDYAISCRTLPSSLPCTHFVQVECGDCHLSETIRFNSSTLIRSPLYPVLQPNMICKYDLYMEAVHSLGAVDIRIDELSLKEPVLSLGDPQPHCVHSFLLLQSGSSETDISLSETLCGEHRSLTIRTDGHFIRLILVTGQETKGKAGFQIRLEYSEATSLLDSKVFIFFATFFVVFIGLGLIVACFMCALKKRMRKRRRHRRRRAAWQGTAPPQLRPGQTLHEARTSRLRSRLMLEARENNYIFDNRVPVPFPTTPSDQSQQRPLPELPGPVGHHNASFSGLDPGAGETGSHTYQPVPPPRPQVLHAQNNNPRFKSTRETDATDFEYAGERLIPEGRVPSLVENPYNSLIKPPGGRGGDEGAQGDGETAGLPGAPGDGRGERVYLSLLSLQDSATFPSPICVLASEMAANPSRGDGGGDDKAGEASATMTKRREDIYELQDGNYHSKKCLTVGSQLERDSCTYLAGQDERGSSTYLAGQDERGSSTYLAGLAERNSSTNLRGSLTEARRSFWSKPRSTIQSLDNVFNPLIRLSRRFASLSSYRSLNEHGNCGPNAVDDDDVAGCPVEQPYDKDDEVFLDDKTDLVREHKRDS